MIFSKSFTLTFISILLVILYNLILLVHSISMDYSKIENDNKMLKEELVWDKELRNKLQEMKTKFDGIGGYVEATKEDIDEGNLPGINEKIDKLPKEYLQTIFTDLIIKHGINLYYWIYKDFDYPVKYPEKSFISSEFYNLRQFNNNLVYHQAIDIVCTNDYRILASADGIIKDIGYNSILGKYIDIRHDINGEFYLTEYAHASQVYVKIGQKVKKGDVIAIIGLTGNTSGYHLHFALKKWNQWVGNYIPVNILATSTMGLKIK
jgi:murein DD-endopeptidase MepM/ murein hydrolase activator NlpD